MDQREDPGISPPIDPSPPRRFPRLMAPPTVRRLAPSRMILVSVGAICAMALVWLTLSHLWRGARRYVDDQPEYRLSYREIILDPKPPTWYRGGSDSLLEHALGAAGEFRAFSVLNFDRERMLLLFRRYAWVKNGLRVEIVGRNQVVVRLNYREPVAVERLPDAMDRTVIDGDGVILPREDIDFEQVGPLVRLYGFSPPADPRPGLFWNRIGPGQGLLTREERVRNAARLAAFFRNELRRESASVPALRVIVIHPWGSDGSSVQVGSNLMFKWDEPGPSDPAGHLSDEAKWAMLLDRVVRVPPKEDDPWIELKFTMDGVQVDEVHNAPRQATQRDNRVPLHRTNQSRPLDRKRETAGY